MEYTPLLGILVYFFVSGALEDKVTSGGFGPSKAFWLGAIFPIVIFFPLLIGSYAYRQWNGIYYEQEYLVPWLLLASVGVGLMKGLKFQELASKGGTDE